MSRTPRTLVVGSLSAAAAAIIAVSGLITLVGAWPASVASTAHSMCGIRQLSVSLEPTLHNELGGTETAVAIRNTGPTCTLTLSRTTLEMTSGRHVDVRLPRAHALDGQLIEHGMALTTYVLSYPSHVTTTGVSACPTRPWVLHVGHLTQDSITPFTIRLTSLTVCPRDGPSLYVGPLYIHRPEHRYPPRSPVSTPGWSHAAPSAVLAAIRESTVVPVGASGSILYVKLGTVADLPQQARQQLTPNARSAFAREGRMWIVIVDRAPIMVIGCPIGAFQPCPQSLPGTAVAIVTPTTNVVVTDMGFSPPFSQPW